MNTPARDTAITLSIAAVERDTGLSKDTLRVWERRYGFPMPQRDAIGERAYALEQVEKLRVVKRLLDAGHRPGRIVPLSLDALQLLSDKTVDQPARAGTVLAGAAEVRELMALVRGHDLPALRHALSRLLARLGVSRFVQDVVAPLSVAVGDAWVRGQLEVFEEHVCTEALQAALRQAIVGLPVAGVASRPRVLLSTFPGEPHALGLLMAEAMLMLEGCACIPLGLQTPVWDIALAAKAYRADIVALSFTGCMNPNQVVDGLTELVAKLPPGLPVWVGGSAPVLHRRAVRGVQPVTHFGALPGLLDAWRLAQAASASPATGPRPPAIPLQ